MAKLRKGETCPDCGKVIVQNYICGSCQYEQRRFRNFEKRPELLIEAYKYLMGGESDR